MSIFGQPKKKKKKIWQKFSKLKKNSFFYHKNCFWPRSSYSGRKNFFLILRFFSFPGSSLVAIPHISGYIGLWYPVLSTKVCCVPRPRTQRVEGVSPPYLWRFTTTYRCESHTGLVGVLLLYVEYGISPWTMVFLIFENLPCRPKQG